VRDTLAAQNAAVQGLVASWAKTHAASGTRLARTDSFICKSSHNTLKIASEYRRHF
jgi:hypothetical protein